MKENFITNNLYRQNHRKISRIKDFKQNLQNVIILISLDPNSIGSISKRKNSFLQILRFFQKHTQEFLLKVKFLFNDFSKETLTTSFSEWNMREFIFANLLFR